MEDIQSILTSVKKVLGIDKAYTNFDSDLVLHINSVFAVLSQLGVGPDGGFSITGADELWTSYLPSTSKNLEFVKSYMYLKVRLLFDPPQSAAAIDSFERQEKELEWRIMVAAEGINGEGGNQNE